MINLFKSCKKNCGLHKYAVPPINKFLSWQTTPLCIGVKLAQGGSATNGATPSGSSMYVYIVVVCIDIVVESILYPEINSHILHVTISQIKKKGSLHIAFVPSHFA